MRYNGENLSEVLEAHRRWLTDGVEPNDEDRADFSGCDLRGSDFRGAYLWGANFRNAILRNCDLRGADLRRADLTGVSWMGAYLERAELRGAINVPYVPLACPDTGAFIGWKKAIYVPPDGTIDPKRRAILKLLIPEDAERMSDTSRECRCTKAMVLEMQTLGGEVIREGSAVAIRDRKTPYHVGEMISVPKLGEDRFYHLSGGIFFFINRQDAVEYLTLGMDANGNLLDIDFKPMEEADKWIRTGRFEQREEAINDGSRN